MGSCENVLDANEHDTHIERVVVILAFFTMTGCLLFYCCTDEIPEHP